MCCLAEPQEGGDGKRKMPIDLLSPLVAQFILSGLDEGMRRGLKMQKQWAFYLLIILNKNKQKLSLRGKQWQQDWAGKAGQGRKWQDKDSQG